MRHALRLAQRALGTTAPNPAVGCVIVGRDGHIVGRGWTQPGGRPHAETLALAQAGARARAATAYVTLEPCAHHGAIRVCRVPDSRIWKSTGSQSRAGLAKPKRARLTRGFSGA